MRADLEIVAHLIEPGSRVLDLGCGDGALLAHLAEYHDCTGTGVDSDPASLIAAIRRGVSVIDLDIDTQLAEFADRSYDIVVVSQTLQAVRQPAELLEQVRRIAGLGVVSIPNFAFYKHRLSLLTTGRMPVSKELPYAWYETPNIHLSTLGDIEDLFADRGFVVRRRVLLSDDGTERRRRSRWCPANLMASGAAYLISADS